MAYKLAEEDKLCGIEYPTYEGYKPIPKATCEMLETQCGSIEVVFNCEKKKEEDKPKPKPDEPTPKPEPKPEPNPEEPKPQPNPVEPTPDNPVEPTPNPDPKPTPMLTNEELDTIVSGKLRSDGILGKYIASQNNKLIEIVDPTPEEIEAYKKGITDKVRDIPELEGYTVEVSVDKIPSGEPEVGSEVTGTPLYTKIVKITKPNGDIYQSEPMSIGTTTDNTIDLLEALPKVEGKFSTVVVKDGQVVEVPEVSNEDKRAFEDKIINDLKAKLPEGTTVEAVLEGPKYGKGSELIYGKTNYELNVRVTKDNSVYEHKYKVPHTEEEPSEVPEVDIDNLINSLYLGIITIDGDEIVSIEKLESREPITDSTLHGIGESFRANLEKTLNLGNESSNKYKVNSFTITMLKHVGNHVVAGQPIFSFTANITKPNGEVVVKEGKLQSGWVDTL